MKDKRVILKVILLLALVAGTIYVAYSERTTPYQTTSGKIFGTYYNITYQNNKDLADSIVAQMQKVDASLSMFNEKSTIACVNRGEDIVVDNLFEEVFRLAEKVSADTEGSFDITVAPLVNLWGFGFKQGTDPSKEAVDSIMKTVGYQTVSLKGKHVQKQNPSTMLDCSAIAKGFGCDMVARYLINKGVENFMIEIGGEVVVKGMNDKKKPWKIGINKPTDDSLSTSTELQDILSITDKAMATSGNYRNFYYKDGKKYAHTIDPKTGYPVQHSILSATVLAPSCAKADAYATSLMVMGLEKAQALLKRHNDLSAYIIYADENGENKVWMSESVKKKIVE